MVTSFREVVHLNVFYGVARRLFRLRSLCHFRRLLLSGDVVL